MSEPDVAKLEQLVRSGDTDALGRLLEVYAPRLRNFVQRQMSTALQQKLDPDDVLQEVSISCMRSLPDIELSDREPFAWVCQVAKRRIIDAGRRFQGTDKRSLAREKRLVGGSETGKAGLVEMLVASITSPSQAFSRDQREFRLQQAIEQLPAENQEALRLRYVDALPTKEIAARLNKSDGAIRVMLTRSLKKLQALLAES